MNEYSGGNFPLPIYLLAVLSHLLPVFFCRGALTPKLTPVATQPIEIAFHSASPIYRREQHIKQSADSEKQSE